MTLGPSPLLAAVTIELPLCAGIITPADIAAELAAWLADHQPPSLDGHLLIVVDEREIRIRRPGMREEPWVAPLIDHPSPRLLAGLVESRVLSCAATTQLADGTERYRCNVLVDQYGRHLGEHADGRFDGGQDGWPNMNPADAPPPRPPAPARVLPTRAQLRTVLAAVLDLCDHAPDAPLTYTPAAGCRTCPAISRAADAVAAMIGAPA